MKGRPVLGAVSGLVFGASLSLFLLTIGAVPLDSIVLVVIPALCLVFGIVVGAVAPFKRDRLQRPANAAP
jgi:hypothetical protein